MDICAEARGYFGGVCDIFSVIITYLSPQFATIRGLISAILPPRALIAPLAAETSSSVFDDFIGANMPPTLTNGIQYSARVFRFATALAVTRSNFSRYFISLPASYALI